MDDFVQSSQSWNISTSCVHAGTFRDPHSNIIPVITPIYQSTTYKYPTVNKTPLRYIRYSNSPTQKSTAVKIANIEKGENSICLSSGMAAVIATFSTLLLPGDHIMLSSFIYAKVLEYARDTFPKIGIEYTLVDPNDIDSLISIRQDNTKMLFFETLSNPMLHVADIRQIRKIFPDILIVADNTFATPININPISLGADVVIHSASKYLNGHYDVLAGVVISSTNIIETLENHMKIHGNSLDVYQSSQLSRGLMTLSLRVERQNYNALEIAKFMEQHNKISDVFYPGLESHKHHKIASSIMKGYSGMISIYFNGTSEEADVFVFKLKLFQLAPSLGGIVSLVTQPKYTTHRKLDQETRESIGIFDTMIRFSIGIENCEDLLEDLIQALNSKQ